MGPWDVTLFAKRSRTYRLRRVECFSCVRYFFVSEWQRQSSGGLQ